MKTLKVATFNVNSLRARLPIVLGWLGRESPDVLCMQETKVVDDRFPQKEFSDAGYHSVFRGEKTYNGVAILSKTKAVDVRIGFDESESEGTRLVAAAIREIAFVNVYVPQGYQPDSDRFVEKLQWLLGLYEYLKRSFRPDDPVVLAGDFNVAPEPGDVYDPEYFLGHVGFHPDEHEALERVRKWGFLDVFRKHNPGPGQYSFYDYQVRNAVARNKGWRIDHIWATRPLAERSRGAWIDIEPRLQEKPSDHTVVVAEFEAP